MTEREQLRALVFNASEQQIVATWTREQTLLRDAGLPHYERLVDPTTLRVVAAI